MSSSSVSASLQRSVRTRARECCEYCRLSQAGQEATFHVDHVRPRSVDGLTRLDNLALACVSCSLRKAARTHAQDPATGETVAIFSPRKQQWRDHFTVADDGQLRGNSETGRATIDALGRNRPLAVAIRLEEILRRRHP